MRQRSGNLLRRPAVPHAFLATSAGGPVLTLGAAGLQSVQGKPLLTQGLYVYVQDADSAVRSEGNSNVLG